MSSIDNYYQKDRYVLYSVADNENMYQKKVRAFLKILPKRTFQTVLDAGCGDGRVAQIMGEKLGTHLYGVDISKKGVELAKKNGIKAKVADISESIPLKSGYFDLVISTEVIEHVADPDTFLKETYRVLKPGGLLLLTTPNLSSWTNRILFVLGIYPIFLEASTETPVGYGYFSRFIKGKHLVGHIHVFNLLALKDIITFHRYSIESVSGNSVNFSARSKILTVVYSLFDALMARFPSLSSDLVLLAKK